MICAGMRVNRIGSRSVEYGVGIFCDDQTTASAYGTFTHVFVNRLSAKAVDIPTPMRSALLEIVIAP
jgi:acyl-CoA thioester hydrolase